ncbi:MAG: N-acetylmuramic acid 6-phosphate etherase [Gemmatimonadota bacterium]
MKDLPVGAGAECTGDIRGEQTEAGGSSDTRGARASDLEDPWLLEDPRLTETRNPSTKHIDLADSREIVRLIFAEDRTVPAAVEAQSDPVARLIDEVAARLRRGGRLIYVGAGTSGRLGVLDAAECPPTFGTDPRTVQGIIAGGPPALVRSREGDEDDREGGRAAIREAEVGRRDFVLGIATSGTTPYVRAALEEAAAREAAIGFLSCTEPPERMRQLADVVVTPLVGPEVIAGSTRMKAGTATKLVLNALTTGVMIRLGKVYENLMVDLRATSLKLVDRSLRILHAVCGLRREEARRLLVAAGGSVKTAIAMHELGANRFLAESALDACHGLLGRALERFRPAGTGRPSCYSVYPEVGGPRQIEEMIDRMRDAPSRLRSAVEEAEAAGRRTGRWTTSQHLAHLIQFEAEAVRLRVRAFAVEEHPCLSDWEPSPDPPLEELEPRPLLDRFEAERAETLSMLEAAEAAFFRRRAALGGEELTAFQFLQGVAQHDDAHAIRICERVHPALLEAGAARSTPEADRSRPDAAPSTPEAAPSTPEAGS